MRVSLLRVALPPSTDSDSLVVTELAAAPQYSVSGLINYPTQTQDMSSRAFSVYCSLKSASKAASPATIAWVCLFFHLAEIMAYSTAFVKEPHMTFHAKLCALITQAWMKQNSMSAYKQPNVKFMSGGICFSVINYQHWLEVKRQKRPTVALTRFVSSETVLLLCQVKCTTNKDTWKN